MADPRIYYDTKTHKITRVDPPELRRLIEPVAETGLVSVPDQLFDLKTLKFVRVQVSAEPQTRKG